MTYSRHRLPGKPGRKPLASTVWLAARLRENADPWAHFDAWKAEHEACMGYPCKDARRSFRAALKIAERLAA